MLSMTGYLQQCDNRFRDGGENVLVVEATELDLYFYPFRVALGAVVVAGIVDAGSFN